MITKAELISKIMNKIWFKSEIAYDNIVLNETTIIKILQDNIPDEFYTTKAELIEKREHHINRDIESRWHNIEEIIRDLKSLQDNIPENICSICWWTKWVDSICDDCWNWTY